jgi:hypothetical protein
MHTRRLSVFLIAAWLSCTLFMGWVAVYNMKSVDLTVKSPVDRIQREMRDFGLDRARALVRFHSAELNRHYFFYWEITQIALGIALSITILFATNGNRFAMTLAAIMLIVAIVQHFTITPQILEIGRGLDFATTDEMIDERRSFGVYHAYYSYAEIAKAVAGACLGIKMLFSSGSSGRRRRGRKKIDVVDDPDDSHVDG